MILLLYEAGRIKLWSGENLLHFSLFRELLNCSGVLTKRVIFDKLKK